jgi:hypothetical protein
MKLKFVQNQEKVHIFNIVISKLNKTGYSWQQAIFPFFPLKVDIDCVIRFEICIKDNALHVQPIGMPAIPKELIRAPLCMDILAMV